MTNPHGCPLYHGPMHRARTPTTRSPAAPHTAQVVQCGAAGDSVAPPPLDDQACYLALAARDARFDGRFFTGVTSTGIYCRPICRVRTPQAANCVFFNLAAQAEQAGFRPCLRCRPELAPQTRHWSAQDATQLLLQQACQWLAHAASASHLNDGAPLPRLAQRLGVSERHVRRIFQTHLGVSPLQYLQTQRLLTAKQLLTDTQLPMSEVAWLSGFASVRRFNASLQTHYALTPSAMRKHIGHPQASSAAVQGAGTRVRLAYRPPVAIAELLRFLALRAIKGVECVDLAARRITRTLAVRHLLPATASAAAPTTPAWLTGWIQVTWPNDTPCAELTVSDDLCHALPAVISRVRDWLDLDADPAAVAHTLAADFPLANGLRVPGTVDSFELAVRAVLGQMVTVQAATTVCQRVAHTWGSPVDSPWPGLTHLFPTPEQWLAAPAEALGALGITRQKQLAIGALAQHLQADPDWLSPGADPHATHAHLLTLPGVGPWTASYIVMRSLHWPDAFPAGDVALQTALRTRQLPHPQQATTQRASVWQPWRSYAAMALWQGMGAHDTTI